MEPTSGNTGIALAFVCAAQGLPLHPHDARDDERGAADAAARLRRRAGADPGRRGHARRDRARPRRSPRTTQGAFVPQQFQNPANPEVHRRTTAEEIWADTGGEIDVLVAGVGTGGTITGVGRGHRERQARLHARSRSSRPTPRSCRAATPGPHKIQGIGAGFVPGVLNTRRLSTRSSPVDRRRRVRDGAAAGAARRASWSASRSGANVWAAVEVARRPGECGQADRHLPLRHRRALPHHPALRRGLRRPPGDRRGASHGQGGSEHGGDGGGRGRRGTPQEAAGARTL